MTAAELKAALTDRDVVAMTLWGEARSEPVEGRIAVANVIRNRVRAGRFGVGYRGVCLRRWQFSCWEQGGGAANYGMVLATAEKVLHGGTLSPVLRECQFLAGGVMGDALLDSVKNATHYLTRARYASKPPAWTKGIEPVIGVGAHLFFRAA